MRVTRRRFLTGSSSTGTYVPVQAASVRSSLRPAILKRCLVHGGVTCRTCVDACDQGAVRLQVKRGGVAIPHVLFDLCTGCGVCGDVCPAQAIAMHLLDESAAI